MVNKNIYSNDDKHGINRINTIKAQKTCQTYIFSVKKNKNFRYGLLETSSCPVALKK